MSIRSLTLALSVSLALPTVAAAQRLGIGDPAPRIQVHEWLKGEPIKAFEEGKPYVVEFWATWCPPCRTSIPHITELQKTYKERGLRVIGVAVNENDWDGVAPFVKKMGDKMDYWVASDDRSGFMNSTWLQAAGATGIPTAFLVDQKGRIAWIGHPMEMDEPVARLVAGELDIEKARAEAQKTREMEQKLAKLEQRLGEAMSQNDFEAAVKVVDEAMQVDPRLASTLAPLRFDLLLRTKDYERAYAYARKAVKEVLWEEPAALNNIVWAIVDPRRPELPVRDLDLALLVAERLNVLTEHKDFSAVDTLARVRFTRGEVEAAVELQRKAIALAAEDPNAKLQLESTLAVYEKALSGVLR